jgi:hypothetical protein
MRTRQPQVTCNPPSIVWNANPNYLTCERVDDSTARCRDASGFEHYFRRKK